jgi:hypothetical protein
MTADRSRLFPARVGTVFCLLSLACWPLSALAYLDPGSGSLIFQSLLAILFGLGVGLRAFRAAISRFIDRLLRRNKDDVER